MMQAEKKSVPELRFPEFTSCFENTLMGTIYPQIRNGFVGTATPFYCESGIQYVQGRNVKSGEIQNNGFVSITQNFHDKCAKSQLKTDDILMVQSGHVGECAVVTEDFNNANCHALLVLTPKKNAVDSRFYVSYFYSPLGRQKIHIIKTGNTVAHILSSDLKKVTVPLPTLPEQQKIADFLTAVDARISQLIQKKALLEDYKKGLMQQLFSQTLRFKDDNGNDFPEWEEIEFEQIAAKSKTKHNPAKSDQDWPCVELESLSQNTGKLLETFSSSSQKSIKNKFSVGEVLFGKLRPYLKKFLHADFDGVCSSEIWVLTGKSVSNEFLYQLIQTHHFHQAANVSSGSKMPRSDWGFLASFPFQYPSTLPEQRKIADCLSALDRRIESLATRISLTQEFKKGLLQKMFV